MIDQPDATSCRLAATRVSQHIAYMTSGQGGHHRLLAIPSRERLQLRVECPTSSGNWVTLRDAAHEISRRLVRIFTPGKGGIRACYGQGPLMDRFATDPAWKDLVLFHEYFDGDTGQGLGASHQTGWTGGVIRLIDHLAARHGQKERVPPATRESALREVAKAVTAAAGGSR